MQRERRTKEQKIEEVIARLEGARCCYWESLLCKNNVVFMILNYRTPTYYICEEHLRSHRSCFPKEAVFQALFGREIAKGRGKKL